MDHPAPPAGQYPRLFFSSQDLPALRAKLEHPDCRSMWRRLLHGCEQMLTPQPAPLYPRHIRASHLAFAFLVTGREAFADRAVEMAMAIAGLERFVALKPGETQPGVCLATGSHVTELTLVYDWLNDRLTPAQKARIRDAIRRNGFDANRYDFDRRRPASDWHLANSMSVINGPLLAAAILLEGEMDTRDGYELALRQVRASIDAYCPDGGYQEGPLYWNYAMRHMLLGVEALRRHKGVDLYHEPFLHNTANYTLHHILPWLTRCANTADADDATHAWAPVARLASYHRRPQWQWLARRIITHAWPDDDGETLEYSLFYLLWYDPALPDSPPTDEQATHLFGGLQALSLRSGWGERAVHVLWLNGPSNCSHNHLHLNSFTLSAFGRRLLVEMGKHDYANHADYRRRTQGHNTLLVEGDGQAITTDDSLWCRALKPGRWGTVFGEFRGLREEAGATIATGSVVNAYPGPPGSRARLRSYDRTLAFIERSFLFLHDHVELGQDPPVRLDWLFHAEQGLEIHDGSALFRTDHARLRLLPLCELPIGWSIGRDHRRLNSPRDHDPYLDMRATCAGPACDFYALLVPFEGDAEPALTLRKHEDGVLLGVAGREWVYEYRTRSLRRATDAPLPRKIV